eukprot:SAG11_NODE_502_length_8891_cov_4.603731_4_plen_230_part_00
MRHIGCSELKHADCLCAPCQVTYYSYECGCVIGFEGHNCDVDTDECPSAPCANGAACRDSTTTVRSGLLEYTHADPVVTALEVHGILGYTTFELSLELKSEVAANVYTSFGHVDHPMYMPPAYQVDAPFGANVGGVDPALVAVNEQAAYDSWLTVGVVDGDTNGVLGHIGIDFSTWTLDSELLVDNGAVFWMDPDTAPEERSAIMGQITVPTGSSWQAIIVSSRQPWGL